MCLNGDMKNLINTFYRVVMNTVIIKSNDYTAITIASGILWRLT